MALAEANVVMRSDNEAYASLRGVTLKLLTEAKRVCTVHRSLVYRPLRRLCYQQYSIGRQEDIHVFSAEARVFFVDKQIYRPIISNTHSKYLLTCSIRSGTKKRY